MDPRLNPNLSLPSAQIMQDVRPLNSRGVQAIEGPNPPAPQKPLTNPPVRPDDVRYRSQIKQNAIPSSNPSPNLAPNTEVVESIPLRQPVASSATLSSARSDQIIQMPGSYSSTEPQDDLDKILQAVNSRVNSPVTSALKNSKKTRIFNIFSKVTKAKKASQNSKPVLAMTVVVMIAMILSFVAVLAYRQGSKASTLTSQPGRVGTSSAAGDAIQAAGGTLVRPSDLDDYSQTLQQSLNSLNDKQDFDSASLSDQVIGL